MAESDRPHPDDEIVMPFMGADARITVVHVPEWQPHEDRGLFRIIDQYDDVHVVERDGESWVVSAEELVAEPTGPRL